MPSFHPASVAKTRWSELVLRFAFGGVVTALTGLIANAYGPSVGGLFLAFPAILPASLTLLKQHHARIDAVCAAAGSRLGALGLGAFAIATGLLASRANALLTLTIAGVTWTATSIAAWQLAYHRRGHTRRRTAQQR